MTEEDNAQHLGLGRDWSRLQGQESRPSDSGYTKAREAESWDGHELEPAGPWCHCKNNTKGNEAKTLSGPSIVNVLG